MAKAFEARGIHALHVTQGDDGLWYASFETKRDYTEPEPNIEALLTAIETLPERHRSTWHSTRREFNIGYDYGTEPWSFEQGLSCELLCRIAGVGASLQSLYAYREDGSRKISGPQNSS